MDNLADHLFIFEGDGVIRDYNGNYTDYRQELAQKEKAPKVIAPVIVAEVAQPKKEKSKPSFKEVHEHQQLEKEIPGIEFNGETSDEKSLYTVLNCRFPAHPDAEMMLFNLDIMGIAASGGSACSSGSNQGSHVLRGIGADVSRASVRFSFCKYTTKEEIDYTIEKLKGMLK